MQFEAKAVINVYPSGDKFTFNILKQEQLDKLIEILRILEESAKSEQELRRQESQQSDEENLHDPV
jgi:hypothetical protein